MSYQDFLKFQKEYENNGISGVVKKISPKQLQQEQTPQIEQINQPSQEGGFFSSSNPKLLTLKPTNPSNTMLTDIFNKNSASLPMRSQAKQNQINEQYNQWQQNPLKNVAEKTIGAANIYGNSMTLGALPMYMKKTNPEMYQTAEELKTKFETENPYLSKGVGILGYITPGSAGNLVSGALKTTAKSALKSIPALGNAVSKYLPATDFIGKVAKSGLIGGAEGATMGAIEGTNEGIKEDYSVGDIAKNALTRAAEFGATGAVLGGGLSALGQGFSKLNNRITSSIDDTFGGYRPSVESFDSLNLKSPMSLTEYLASQQRPLALKPGRVPDSEVIFAGDGIVPPIPKTEPLQLPSGQTPLMLKEGTFLQPPVKPIGLGEAPKGKFTIKSESDYLNLTPQQLNKLKSELTSEISKVEDNMYKALKKQGNQGVDVYYKENIRPKPGDNRDIIRNTVSNNPLWYSKEFEAKGGKLADYDYKNIAKKYLREGYEDSSANIPPDNYYLALKNQLDNVNNFISEKGFKNISDFTPQNKTLEPIKKYAQQMEQYNNPFKQENNFKIEKPFQAFPGEVKNINVPPKVLPQFSKEIFPKLPNMKNIKSKTKTMPTESNLNPLKTESSINSPSTKLNAPETLTTQNNINLIENPQFFRRNKKIPQNVGENIIPPRENVNNVADVGTGNLKNRQFVENSYMNSDAVPQNAKNKMENNIPQYEQISNQKTLEEAQRIVDSNFDEAISNFRTSKKLDNAVDTAIGETLIQRAYAKGDFNTGNEIALNLAEKLTNAGQIVQAASIMKRMTPEGMLKHITKTLESNKGKALTSTQSEAIYNNMKLVQLAEQGKLKLLDIDLQLFGREHASLREQLNAMAREQGDSILDAAMSRRVSDAALDNVSYVAANNLPVSRMDKVNAWRRMAMLANPKTHIRNFGGNLIMAGLRKTSDTIGAGLEKVFVKQGERTKSFGWSKDEDLVRLVDTDWNFHKNNLMKGGKFDFDTVFLNNEKQIFEKGRLTKFIEKQTGKQYDKGILEAMNQFSRDALNASDNIFLQRAYKDALGGYMKANGLKTVTNEARLYAARRGYEAVFKQANEFSNWISKMKSRGGIGGAILEAKIPFSKTPSNILLRGIEYSPVGILKSLYSAAKGKTAATVIEDFSKGLTGTAIYGLGLTLAAMGWARTETSKSKALKSLESESGKQPYSIDTPFGNYTFEWAQPTSIPLAMGVATMEALTKKAKGEEDIKAHEMIMKGLASGGDTLFNTTMLKGISDLVGGKYGSPSEALLNVPADYVQQSIPSVLSMINRSFIDTTKRDVSGGFGDLLQSKLPFFSKNVPAKIDVYGREEKYNEKIPYLSEPISNALQQFILPSSYKSDKSDDTTKELLRLNKATGETKFLPSMGQKQLTYQTGKKTDSKKLLLPPNLKEDYSKQLGQASKLKLDQTISSGQYKNASDKDKVKMLDSAMNEVKEKQENIFLKQQGINEYKQSKNRGRR